MRHHSVVLLLLEGVHLREASGVLLKAGLGAITVARDGVLGGVAVQLGAVQLGAAARPRQGRLARPFHGLCLQEPEVTDAEIIVVQIYSPEDA